MTPTPEDLEDAKKLYAEALKARPISAASAVIAHHIARIRAEAEAKGRAEAWTESAKLVNNRAETWPSGNLEPYPTYRSDIENIAEELEDRADAERAKLAKSGEGKS